LNAGEGCRHSFNAELVLFDDDLEVFHHWRYWLLMLEHRQDIASVFLAVSSEVTVPTVLLEPSYSLSSGDGLVIAFVVSNHFCLVDRMADFFSVFTLSQGSK
jgi:hypothetical protein